MSFNMNYRWSALLTILTASSALATAYFVQHVLSILPCELCLWERWPYRVVVALGVLAAALKMKAARRVLGVAGLVMLVNVVISGLHVGVEFNWWPSPLPECNDALVSGQSLPLTPATPCDSPVYLIHNLPISMAQMDFVFSGLFSILLLAYAVSRQRDHIRAVNV